VGGRCQQPVQCLSEGASSGARYIGAALYDDTPDSASTGVTTTRASAINSEAPQCGVRLPREPHPFDHGFNCARISPGLCCSLCTFTYSFAALEVGPLLVSQLRSRKAQSNCRRPPL